MAIRTTPGSVLMELPGAEADHTTTLAQLGRSLLRDHLAARDIVYSNAQGYVMMRVGPGPTYWKLIIKLRPSDTYGVEIGRLKRHEGLPEFFSVHVLEDGIYADQLTEIVGELCDTHIANEGAPERKAAL